MVKAEELRETNAIGWIVDVVKIRHDSAGALTRRPGPPSTENQVPVQSQSSSDRGVSPANEGVESANAEHPRHHDRGLLAIGLFKLGKAILFFCIGIGALHLLHKDLGDEVLRLATALKFDPESRFVTVLLDKVDLIDAHRLKQISAATFGYSALALTEGIGLMLERVWAEYLTLFLTISFLPWELYELIHRPSWFRLSLLLINLAVLAYLVWLLRKKRTAERA